MISGFSTPPDRTPYTHALSSCPGDRSDLDLHIRQRLPEGGISRPRPANRRARAGPEVPRDYDERAVESARGESTSNTTPMLVCTTTTPCTFTNTYVETRFLDRFLSEHACSRILSAISVPCPFSTGHLQLCSILKIATLLDRVCSAFPETVYLPVGGRYIG